MSTTPTTPDNGCAPFCAYHVEDECTGTETHAPVLIQEHAPVTGLTVYPTRRDDIEFTGVFLAPLHGTQEQAGVYLTPAQARYLALALTAAAQQADK